MKRYWKPRAGRGALLCAGGGSVVLPVVPEIVTGGTGVVVPNVEPDSSRKRGRPSTFVIVGLPCGDPGVAPDGYDPPSPVCAKVALTPRLKITIAMRSNHIAMPLRKRRPNFARGRGEVGHLKGGLRVRLNRSRTALTKQRTRWLFSPRLGKYLRRCVRNFSYQIAAVPGATATRPDGWAHRVLPSSYSD